jgi:ADP-heptose:LPS heptosyltransferase
MRLAVGLASGLGNAVFMLPTIKALKAAGHKVALYVQTDFPTTQLWRRCAYADEVHEIGDSIGDARILSGQWMPQAWSGRADLRSAAPRFQVGYPYRMSEAESNLRIAEHFGYPDQMPDVSEWCRDLDRSRRWDVGIVPGSKGGIWMRKRYAGMSAVAQHFLNEGAKVAVFGLDGDGVETIPGERINTKDIATLPDALAGCRLIIGTDSGAAHLASSLGVPVVMVFTATSPTKGRPIGPHIIVRKDLACSPCQSTMNWQRCGDWRCGAIEPSGVIKAAEDLIAEVRQ